MTRKPIDPDAPPMALSPQQKMALWLYASDMDIQQVADIMQIKRPTAKEHLHRAYKNLGTSCAEHAIKVAYELGIFTPPHLRDAAERLEALEQKVIEQAEIIQRASEGVDGKVVAPESAVALIQTVAMQLSTMAHVTSGQGLARELRTMSNNLDRALRQIRAATVESPLDGATRALENVGMHGVNRIFVGVVLEDHPEIKHLADEWDWSDTEVRERLAQHIICDMLCITRARYEEAHQTEEGRQNLMKWFWTTHEKWS